ncbi:MAG: hypothetical protein LLF83_02645 [Methanobacterium sp.]|nr:hypothetical protein [Methanobacterium sp.]
MIIGGIVLKCDIHRDKDAIDACVSCGRGICEDCSVSLDAIVKIVSKILIRNKI